MDNALTDLKQGHTPGPWFGVPYGDGDSLVICSDQHGQWRICFMATPGDMFSHDRMDTIRANARLIAAAPELLEALEGLLRDLAYDDEEGLFEHSETVINARRAIARATGAAS